MPQHAPKYIIPYAIFKINLFEKQRDWKLSFTSVLSAVPTATKAAAAAHLGAWNWVQVSYVSNRNPATWLITAAPSGINSQQEL